MQNLEGNAKDDENLVPVRISKKMKLEKERDKGKKGEESEKEKMIKPDEKENLKDSPPTLPAIMHEKEALRFSFTAPESQTLRKPTDPQINLEAKS